MSILDTFMNMNGEMFEIEREGQIIATLKGLMNEHKGRKLCNFYPDADVKENDWIIRQETGERFFISEIEYVRFNGKMESINAFYLTENESKKQDSSAGNIFNVQNAYGSVIGTGNTATINYGNTLDEIKKYVNESVSPDKAELEKIVSLLEMIVNDQIPASKGLFSRFSAVMERYSWLSGAVAGTLLSWLTSSLPGMIPQ